MKGIRSPWAQAPTPPSNPLEGARPGRQPVRLVGRAYAVLVELPLRIDEDRARTLALGALGEGLLSLQALGPEFEEELALQKLSMQERPLGPCVTLPLGPVTLYAAASSTDEALALAMAVDRLALAVTRLTSRGVPATETLTKHYTTILRTR